MKLVPVALALVFLLSAASPALATTQDCLTYGPLFQHWDGSSWTQVAGAANDSPAAVVALSSTDVWTVAAGSSRPAAEHWDGSSWQLVSMPRPSHWTADGALDLSASGPDDAWALLGSTLERWDGSTWSTDSIPKRGNLDAIAALSPTNVWGVGTHRVLVLPKGKPCCSVERSRTLVLHWNGFKWRRLSTPNPSYANPLRVRGGTTTSAT
jgi:hypothetical protein